MKKIFGYLDRYFVNPKRNPKYPMFPTLLEVGVNHFKSCVYDEVKGFATDGILAAIPQILNNVRNAKVTDDDKTFLKNIVNFYECMGIEVYREDFEKPLYDSSRKYYATKRQEWLEELRCAANSPEYIARAYSALEEEKSRVHEYLNPISEKDWLHECRDELFGKPSELVIAGDLGTVLSHVMSYLVAPK